MGGFNWKGFREGWDRKDLKVVAQGDDFQIADRFDLRPDRVVREAVIVDSTPTVEKALVKHSPDEVFAYFARSVEAVSAIETSFVNILGVDSLPIKQAYLAASRTSRLALQCPVTPKASFDPARLPGLRRLSIPWQALSPVAMSPDLEALAIWKMKESDLEILSRFPRLRAFKTVQAKNLVSLRPGKNTPPLEELWVSRSPNLEDISGVAEFSSTLRVLAIETCRRIGDIDPVGLVPGLTDLEVGDCGPIASIRPLSALRRLEMFYFWGDTNVMDGDLSPLLEFKNLVVLRMQSRRHYRPGLSEVVSALGIDPDTDRVVPTLF